MKLVALLFVASWVALISPSSSQEHYASGYIERFICKDGFIIDETWHCDGSEDCPDGSDEENCPLRCDIHQFRCHDSSLCISRWKVCNGKNDCPDASDESQCVTPTPVVPTCSEDQQLCAHNLSCVWSSFLCDGDHDCSDSSDELNCDIRPSGCTDNQFQCDNGWCIPRIYMCDGEKDCYGDEEATDELHCGFTESPACGDGFFNCSNGKCINIHNFCDQQDDCSDNSDEENCPLLKCPHRKFGCLVKGVASCIQKAWVCDGEGDCDNAEDEYDCEGSCPVTHFQCTSTTQCIPMDKRCDGVRNCNDSSDEYICPFAPPPGYCEDSQILCLDGTSCVEAADICNGHSDCMDNSDEEDFCRGNATSCADSNGGCQHTCHTHFRNHTVCSCRPGYQLNSTDLKSCHDYDECSHPDTCVQLCTNSEGSFSCSCAAGYHLTESGDCKATGPKANLVFANRVDIRSVRLDGRMKHLLVKHLKYAADVDYHYELGFLYWVDLKSDRIMRADLEDGYNVTAIINSSLEGPSGLAVDWVNDKLYWTDLEIGVIEVAELDGRHRKRLFSVNLEKPRAIVVDPLSRLMFWTDWGSLAKIERASMDGKGRTVVHSEHLIWPNALTLDIPTKSMYWADAKLHIIESSDYFGRNRRPIVTAGILHPFAITTFENKLYWSDWNSLSILSARKNRRNVTLLDNPMILEEHLTQNTSSVHKDLFYPMGLRVVQPALQPSYVGENPCERVSNTGNSCQFLCLLSSEREEGYSCACPTGTELGPNGTECNAINNFLVYSRRGGIHLVTLEEESADIALPVTDVNGPAGVDIDPVTKVLYWTDIFRDEISSLNLEGFRQKRITNKGLVTPAGIAVDWIGRKLYWTNDLPRRDAIEVSELDGTNRMTLLTRDVEKPRDIVVHPTAGYLFWTELSETRPLIGRANLDGSEKIIIVDTGLELPNGLALDYDLDRLYWCDARTNLIEYANLDGSNRTVLVPRAIHPFGLTIYGNQLFWTDWVQGSIEVVNKMTGVGVRSFLRNLGGITDLHAFSGTQELEMSHPCAMDNGGCSHLCLARPSLAGPGQLQASCVCPKGLTVMEDGKTCFEEIQQLLIYPTSNSLVQLSLDNGIFAPTPLTIPGFQEASSVDVDLLHNTVYWTNKLEGKIYRSPLSGGARTPVVTLDLDNPEALVVDWIGQYVFWADSGTESIEVARLDGTNRKLLISGDLTQITSLALDLEGHSLYWVDAGDEEAGKLPKIEMSAMDGSGRRSVVSGMSGLPRSVTVYHPPGAPGGHIYWTNELNRTIESATLNGSDRTFVAVLNESSFGAPYGIAVSDNYIYWTDIGYQAIYRMPLQGGGATQRGRREVADTELYMLLNTSDALGPLTLVRRDNMRLNNSAVFGHPCSNSSNPCSHLCLPNWSSSGYSCQCPTGLKLRTQNTCWNVPRKFALAASVYNIHRIIQSSPDAGIKQTVKGNIWGPVAMDHILYSQDSGRVFFSDQFRRVISSMKLDGSDQRDILSVGLVVGLAVNWVDKYLYWTDSTHKTVEVARLDGTGRKILYQYPVTVWNVTEPRGMALHPKRGVMFWTDWGSHQPSIMRARMDGSFVSPIVEIDIRWPNAVTVDYETDTIYWIDAFYHLIEQADMNGRNRKIVLRNAPTPFFVVFHGFDVIVRNDIVYWTDWYQSSLFKSYLPPESDTSAFPGNFSLISHTSDRYFGFTIVDMDDPRQGELTGSDSVSACGFRNGGCGPTYLCLPINHRERLCACPDNATNCLEYYGYKGQPPPPSVVSNQATTASPVTTPIPDRHTMVATVTTSLATTTTGGDGSDKSGGNTLGGAVDVTAEVLKTSKRPSLQFYTSIPESVVIVITLIVMVFVVMVSLIIIFIVTIYCIKRQKKMNVYVMNTQRKQFSNPIYVSMNANRRRVPSHSSSSSSIPQTPSKEEGFSLLPKLNNAKVIQDAPPTLQTPQDRARKTNSNIFVEEPDVFIMPGQPSRAPRRARSPDLIPNKPPLPAPQDGEPLKLLPPPPPIPPKTYVRIQHSRNEVELSPKKVNLADLPAPTTDAKVPPPSPPPAVLVFKPEPKQSNLDRVRSVKFRSDVKVPVEKDPPPPLPSRGECRKPKAQVAEESHDDGTTIGSGIAIVTKDGMKIGEVDSIPSSHATSDYDRLLPLKAHGPSSDYDRLMPATTPTSDHVQLSDNSHAESQC